MFVGERNADMHSAQKRACDGHELDAVALVANTTLQRYGSKQN